VSCSPALYQLWDNVGVAVDYQSSFVCMHYSIADTTMYDMSCDWAACVGVEDESCLMDV